VYGRRILVLIPHPDDEVVGAALAIRRAVADGAAVFGLDLTHGCPPEDALWPWARGAAYRRRVARRRAEAEAAARALGLSRIADDGLPSRRLRHALAAAHARLLAAVDECAADTLWVPAYEGAHADHDCANALACAAAQARPALAVWEFAEYTNAGGRARANTFADAGTAAGAAGGGEVTIDLEDENEGRWKTEMLALYRSEAFNLRHVTGGREVFRERFRPLPAHDYARPPHPGRLFYERYHWVPLPLPQIDRSTGAEVSSAIVAFLAGRD
jgi:LmbE family N-acetylglucosaminyl deacetylase